MPSSSVASDRDIAVIVFVLCPLVYWLLCVIFPRSPVPIYVCVFVSCNMLAKTKTFTAMVRSTAPRLALVVLTLTQLILPSLNLTFSASEAPNRSKFMALPDSSKLELLTAITSLQQYTTNSKKTTTRSRKLFSLMLWRQQKLCEDTGYLKRLHSIEDAFARNQHVLDKVAQKAVDEYGVVFRDFELLRSRTNNNASSLNYRVVEAMGHFVRDWRQGGLKEVEPLHQYVRQQLDEVIPELERKNTCVILPGSGLGGVSHYVALLLPEFGAVHAVEYSGLMHICNRYMYSTKTEEREVKEVKEGLNEVKEGLKELKQGLKSTKSNGSSPSVKNEHSESLHPYIHSNSNITRTANQFRAIDIQKQQPQPSNLSLDHEDFRYYKVPNIDQFKNVVVVSVFFVDTAENLVDYLDAIKNLTAPTSQNSIQNGYWINVGPLKYGSAAQVEPTAQELEQLRSSMGWNDLNSLSCVGKDELVGYITDHESLWQGYYGLVKWTSARKENKVKAGKSKSKKK